MMGGRVGRAGDLPLLFEGGAAATLGDGELLARFLGRGDEAAFGALVDRLGPIVLGVCRRILADPHDVDDAFQATFLVLVGRGAAIRDRDRVATWTYEVAVRVARRARVDAARRVARERRAASPEVGRPDRSADRLELRGQIDEEIARLPEHHRRAVLLCDVEGLSREEAAARLGWTPNMVRGRLDRARARLRDRLARRGLAPDAPALAALLATPPVPPPALVLATARLALGRIGGAAMVAAPALSLSRGIRTMMALSAWKPIAGATLVLALAAPVALRVPAARPGREADPPPPPSQAQAPAPPVRPPSRPLVDVADPPTSGLFRVQQSRQEPGAPRPSMDDPPESVAVRVSGVVRDLAGRPVAGARVHVLGTRLADVPKLTITKELVGSATTDAEGRYRLASVALPTSRHTLLPQALTPYVECQVAAQAPGFGVGWHRGASMYALPLPDPDDIQGRMPLNSPFEMNIHLRPEAELKGRVVDEAGRAVAGVLVEDHDIDLLDERGAETTVRFNPTWGTLPDGFGRATTDADGRFRLPGLPAESCVWLSFDRPRSTARAWLYASTSANRPGGIHEPSPRNHNGRGRHEVYPADLTLTMATPRRLAVRVVAIDDGRPAAGISVGSMGPTMATGTVAGGTTDAEGRVDLDLPPGEHAGLYADPVGPDSRFLRTYLRPLVVADGPAEQPIEFRMRAGVELRVEAVEADTGRGIPGVRFDIKADTPDGEWSRLQTPGIWTSAGASTDAEGRVRALLDPDRKVARRLRVVGVGLEDPNAPPGQGALPRPLPFEAVEGVSRSFEAIPGRPVTLRFLLRKK